MAIVVKSSIKSNFQTGDKPTQTDFEELIDESIPNWFEDLKIQVDGGTTGVYEIQSTASATARPLGAVGVEVISAATTASATGHLGGGTVGTAIFEAATTAAAQNTLGGGTAGKAIFEANTSASAAGIVGSIGKFGIWVPAGSMIPSAVNGCAPLVVLSSGATDIEVPYLAFNPSADESAEFSVAFGNSWDASTNLTFQAMWTFASAQTNGVAWGMQAYSVGDSQTLDGVEHTAGSVVTDTGLNAAYDFHITVESSALAVRNSPAAGSQQTFFRVFRDVSDMADNSTDDALLLGVRLFYTKDAPTDA